MRSKSNLLSASQEVEPFEIELPGSQAAQGAPAEEQQQQEDHDVDDEDEDDEEYSPQSDSEGEKLYRDAVKRESFSAEASIPTGRLRALLGHLDITSAPKILDQGSPTSRVGGIQCSYRDLQTQGPLQAPRASLQSIYQ
jgi:hypothetical protein